MRHSITLYGGALDPTPLAQDDFRWADVCTTLQELVEREHKKGAEKKHMMAWAPHKLALPCRSLENVAHVSMHVLDVDRCNVRSLTAALKGHELASIMYGSPSDDETGPEDERRMRVVIPSSRNVEVYECRKLRFAVAEYLGLKKGCGVEGAKDASKIFFAGRMHGTAPRFWQVTEGNAL